MTAHAAALAPLTLGTAGHVDHGKTALVRALTGVECDRLPEERRRGLTIELGYAPLELPGGRRLSVIDVPGHERLVRTMVAGATGIDLFLLAVAADDGPMPQTLEHLEVLRVLGVERGVVAVTKADLADPAAAVAAVAELLPGVPAVPVSAVTGAGLQDLRATLGQAAAAAPGRAGGDGGDDGAARLPLDRVFTIRGAGTVVTGTLWSGSIGRGDRLLALPGGEAVRVRAVQVHDEPVERALAGQRVAVNVTGRAALARGHTLVGAGCTLPATLRVDAAISWRAGPVARVVVHHGTSEARARAVPLGGDVVQLRLEAPLVVARGDRLVLRAASPPDTVGGGVVVDPAPRRRSTLAAPAPAPPAPAPPPRPAGREPELDAGALALEAELLRHGAAPPVDSELQPAPGALHALKAAGRAARVGRFHVHASALRAVEARVRALAARDGEVTIASLRDDLATSRKYAQAYLEHCDAARITRRDGDRHVLRGR